MRTAISAIALMVLSVSTALAHPRLQLAGPVPGSVIKASPKSLRIQFNEAITLALSGLTLKTAAGEVVATETPDAAQADKRMLVVPLRASLAPGKYAVEWHAVGDDTHPQKGRYEFEIRP
jgi:methionine-rich copper-binding protein CopC